MQKIIIDGSISSATLESVRFQIQGLDQALPTLITLNSDGGSVQDGVAVYNALRSLTAGVTIEVDGWALSVASLILQAASVRRAHENALIMVHAPWTSSTGNSKTLRGTADTLDAVSESMMTGYRRTGQPDSVIRGWLDGADHWFTSSEALSLGLIDEVISDAATLPAPPANASAARHPIPPAISQIFSQRNHMNNPHTQTGNTESIRAAAILAESTRRNDISAKFAHFAQREGVAALQKACENDHTCSPQAAAEKLLAHMGSQCFPIAGRYISDNGFGGDNRLTEFKAAAQDVLLMRQGVKVNEPHPGVRDLRHTGIVAMAESILSMRGDRIVDNSPAGIIRAALGTDDFTKLLANTAGKAMELGYQSAPSGHTLFTGERDVRDFKTQTLVNLSEAPGLDEVPELSEYKQGSMSDSASTFKLATYGKVMQISRQALINDDLGSFTTLPAAFGAASRRKEADIVYGQLTGNPVLGDTFALFSAQHGNLGTAATLSVAALGAARASMRKQKGLNGLEYIDAQPKFLIVPVALESLAEQLLSSLVDPTRTNETPNLEFIRGLTLIADPRLDADSEDSWYLAASPNQIEGILRAYLAGQPRPYLDENAEFMRDAISYKVRLDFAAGVVGYRGLYKNPGL